MEGTHVVRLSPNLQFTVRNIHTVLALAGVALEDESIVIWVERVLDLLLFPEERVLFQCFEIARSLSGLLGFVTYEVWFIQGVIILDVLAILLFTLSFFNFLLFLALFCHFLSSFHKVFILR